MESGKKMKEVLVSFFTAVPFWELLLIFVAKVVEVSMGTLRSILINKGFRKEGTILAFFEIILWVTVASRVITGLSEAPLKAVSYCFGFACGVNIGSRIEQYLAFGRIQIQVIVSEESGRAIAEKLRNMGFGVTTMQAEGRVQARMILMILANRRGREVVIQAIRKLDASALIVTNDVSLSHGGLFPFWRQLVK